MLQPKFVLPIYHDTHDQRICDWINRNLTTDLTISELQNAQPAAQGNIRPNGRVRIQRIRTLEPITEDRGNGNIRAFIGVIALMALTYVVYAVMA